MPQCSGISAFRPGSAERVVLELRGTVISYDARKEELSTKGMVVPLRAVGGVVELRALVDRGSVEVFAQGGTAALAIAAVAPPERRSFALSAIGGTAELDALELWELRSIWP